MKLISDAVVRISGPLPRTGWGLCLALLWLVIGPSGRMHAQESWALGSPTFSVGDADEPESQFHNVEAALIYDGRLYVADRGSAQVRAYDLASGDIVAVAGGQGFGPGEFRWLGWLGQCGDTPELVTFDPVQQRVSIFSPDLEHLQTLRLDHSSWLRWVRCAGPQALVGAYTIGTDHPSMIGPYRTPVELATFSLSDGSRTRTVGTFPGEDRYFDGSNDGPQTWGRQPVLASLPNGFVFGASDRWSLTIHDPTGAIVDSLAIDRPRVSVQANEIDEYHESLLEAWRTAGRPRQWLDATRQAYERYVYPSRYPAYSEAVASSGGYTWVRVYPLPVGQEPSQWVVFSPAGHVVATAEFPDGFSLMWVGDDGTVVGVSVDALGVEQVEWRPIQRRSESDPAGGQTGLDHAYF